MVLLLTAAFAAEPGPAPTLDPALAARIETARTLVAYDVVAWRTTDALLAAGPPPGIGRAWFVLDTGGGPTGWYGRYDGAADRWVPVAAYRMSPDQSVVAVDPALAPEVADPRARAIERAAAHGFPRSLTRLQAYGVNPNVYVLEGAEGLDVWVIPSLAPDGRLVTATCSVQHYTADGAHLLGVDVDHRRAAVHALGADARITLESRARGGPSVCELFWAWYYADDVARLEVHTRDRAVSFTDVEGVGRVPVIVPRAGREE